MDSDTVGNILLELWDQISSDIDLHETMQWFWNQSLNLLSASFIFLASCIPVIIDSNAVQR